MGGKCVLHVVNDWDVGLGFRARARVRVGDWTLCTKEGMLVKKRHQRSSLFSFLYALYCFIYSFTLSLKYREKPLNECFHLM